MFYLHLKNHCLFIIKIFINILIIYSKQQQQEPYIRSELVEALLSDSLRLRFIQACQGDRINLQCPRNTYISPNNAFFGRLVPSSELCPYKKILNEKEDNSCDLTETHSRILDLCRAKRKCRIKVQPEIFGEKDPCPLTGKYLQIGYKCTPVSFEDLNFCEGQKSKQNRLSCEKGKRLSIYSAHYGYSSSNVQSINCNNNDKEQLQQQQFQEGGRKVQQQQVSDCLIDVLPQIASQCHAKPWCLFEVNDDQFLGGNQQQKCLKQQKQKYNNYLSIIFACVDEQVFSDLALKGKLESMEQLKKELELFYRQNNNSNNIASNLITSTKTNSQRIERHPLLSDDEEEENDNEEDFDHNEEEEDEEDNNNNDEYELKKKKKIKEEAVDEVVNQLNEEAKHEATQQTTEKHELPEKENNVEWRPAWPVLNDRQHEAFLFLLLLLSFFLSILILLCACLLWQCRARAKERRDRRRAEEREAAANLRFCHNFGCNGVYPDSSEGGSSHHLINSQPPLLPNLQQIPSTTTTFDHHQHPFSTTIATDVYHGCYDSAGPGSIIYGGGHQQQQHWNGFIGNNYESEENTELLRKYNQQQHPTSLHRYS